MKSLLIEIAVLAVIPVLLLLKFPQFLVFRHLILGFICLYLLFSIYYRQLPSIIKSLNPVSARTILKHIAFSLFIACLITLIYKLNPLFVVDRSKIINLPGWPAYLPLILYPLLSVPLQEFVFRYYVLHRTQLSTSQPLWIIVINAFVFSLVHLPFTSPFISLGTFFCGIWWSYAYLKHRSLWPSLIGHSLVGNCLIFLALFVK